MTREIGNFDHLNDPNDPQGEIVQKISLDELAKKILEMNFGLWRFVSALNRVVNDPQNHDLKHYNGDEVEALVNAFRNLPRY